jgi:ElaB/YqjD/DUF883 family membrane-anchored ribosome-binding protein
MTSLSSMSDQQTGGPPAGQASPGDGDAGAAAAVHRVTGEAPAQAARVMEDAKTQLSGAAKRSLDDVRSQAEDRTAQAARGLRDLSTQVDALVSGRPEEATQLTDLAKTFGQQAGQFADRLDTDGLQGLADDVSNFGRRHPWAFLGMSLGAGFLVGRLVRTTAAVAGEGHLSTQQTESSHAPALSGAPMATGPATGGMSSQTLGVER